MRIDVLVSRIKTAMDAGVTLVAFQKFPSLSFIRVYPYNVDELPSMLHTGVYDVVELIGDVPRDSYRIKVSHIVPVSNSTFEYR